MNKYRVLMKQSHKEESFLFAIYIDATTQTDAVFKASEEFPDSVIMSVMRILTSEGVEI